MIWQEIYQVYAAGENYANQANLTVVKNLKAKLLLAYGDLDDNVQPLHTIEFVPYPSKQRLRPGCSTGAQSALSV
jgi:hypothetical protein